MGLLDLFRRTPPTASVAKERLRIIVAQERSARGLGGRSGAGARRPATAQGSFVLAHAAFYTFVASRRHR